MLFDYKEVAAGINYIKKLKKEKSFQVIDVHVHPVDVMGVVHSSEYKVSCCGSTPAEKKFYSKGILEVFKYGKIINLFSPLYYKIIPQSVHQIIKETFRCFGTKRLLEEMDVAGVDVSVLVPIMPWSGFNKLRELHTGNRFRYLYSPDIHHVNKAKLDEDLLSAKSLGAIGIKLHPNLQSFHPQPSKNQSAIKEKLESIYAFAEKEGMFLLFHGGKSFYTEEINSKYGAQPRSKDFGLLNNFINQDNTSEIFSYNVPIIIAHLGSFGLIEDDLDVAQKIVSHYPNVFFDTAGCSPCLIKKALNMLSSTRIIFGSDALYNRLAYSLYYVYLSTRNLQKEEPDVALQNILSTNIQKIVNL